MADTLEPRDAEGAPIVRVNTHFSPVIDQNCVWLGHRKAGDCERQFFFRQIKPGYSREPAIVMGFRRPLHFERAIVERDKPQRRDRGVCTVATRGYAARRS